MKVEVHQALFGERERGHGLIAHSGVPQAVLDELEGQTDIPANAPTGVPWKPYLTAFPVDNYYVVANTASDSKATRGGMVLTHALVFRAEDAAQIDDFSVMIRLLPRPP